jgi:hypothetical protein
VYCDFDLLADLPHYNQAEIDHLLPPDNVNREKPASLVLACHGCNQRLSKAHTWGHVTVEARRAYLREHESGVRAKFEEYAAKRKTDWVVR